MAWWGVRRELSVVWLPRASADGAKELCCTWKGIDKLKRITAFTCGERLARAQKPLPCAKEMAWADVRGVLAASQELSSSSRVRAPPEKNETDAAAPAPPAVTLTPLPPCATAGVLALLNPFEILHLVRSIWNLIFGTIMLLIQFNFQKFISRNFGFLKHWFLSKRAGAAS